MTTVLLQTKKRRPYTPADNAFIKLNYKGNYASAELIGRHLGRSANAIMHQASKIRAIVNASLYTDEDNELIRVKFNGKKRMTELLAAKLGRTPIAIYRHAQALGLIHSYARCKWTPAKDDKLKELIGEHNTDYVANYFNTSRSSVENRLKRLHVSIRSRTDWYSMLDVAVILGVNSMTIKRYIDTGKLKAHYHTNGRTIWHISRDDLMFFIRRYSDEFTGRNVDLYQIVDIIAGVLYPSDCQ